jgi:hypothetical protein
MMPPNSIISLLSGGLTTSISINLLVLIFLLERYIEEVTVDETQPYFVSTIAILASLILEFISILSLIYGVLFSNQILIFGIDPIEISLGLFGLSLSIIIVTAMWLSSVILRYY